MTGINPIFNLGANAQLFALHCQNVYTHTEMFALDVAASDADCLKWDITTAQWQQAVDAVIYNVIDGAVSRVFNH